MTKLDIVDGKKHTKTITITPPSPKKRFSKYLSLLISHRFGALPDFMIIGSPKCGTTSLYHYLIQHPNILPAFTKETHFFNGYYNKNKNWYKMFFPTTFTLKSKEKKNGRTLTGEATPSYLFHPLIPKRVFNFTPKCKFIIIVRNPIDRAYSHYHNNLVTGVETESFEFATENEFERLKEMDKEISFEEENENNITFFEHLQKLSNFKVQNFQLYSYLKQGIYVESIKRWMNIFPKERFLILETNELLNDSNKITNDVFKFLKLSPHNIPDISIKNKTTKDTMSIKTREKLREFFKPHNEELFELIGRKFDWD